MIETRYLVAIVVCSTSATVSQICVALDVDFDVEHNLGSNDHRGIPRKITHLRLESPAPKEATLEIRLAALLDSWITDFEIRIRQANLIAEISLDIAVLTPKYTHTTQIPAHLMERIGQLQLPLAIVYYPTSESEIYQKAP